MLTHVTGNDWMADGMGCWLPLVSTAWLPPFLSGCPVSALTNKETLTEPSRIWSLTLCYLGHTVPSTQPNLGLLWWRSPAETQEVVWDRDELPTYKTRNLGWRMARSLAS